MNKKTIISLIIVLIVIALSVYGVMMDKTTNPSSPEGAYANTPSPISVTGQSVCLPHKNTNGPQTLECALGVKADDGVYYAMDTSDVSQNPFLDIQTGEYFKITGQLVLLETLSTDQWQKYNIKGIIKVSKIEKI